MIKIGDRIKFVSFQKLEKRNKILYGMSTLNIHDIAIQNFIENKTAIIESLWIDEDDGEIIAVITKEKFFYTYNNKELEIKEFIPEMFDKIFNIKLKNELFDL